MYAGLQCVYAKTLDVGYVSLNMNIQRRHIIRVMASTLKFLGYRPMYRDVLHLYIGLHGGFRPYSNIQRHPTSVFMVMVHTSTVLWYRPRYTRNFEKYLPLN